MNKDYKTKWAKDIPPYGAFEDHVIFTNKDSDKYIMHDSEFNFIGENFYSLYEDKKIKYIQLLKIWNECRLKIPNGTIIKDISETIDALKQLDIPKKSRWGKLSIIDRNRLIKFLNNLKEVKITSDS